MSSALDISRSGIAPWVAAKINTIPNYQANRDIEDNGFYPDQVCLTVVTSKDAALILERHSYEYNRNIQVNYLDHLSDLAYLDIDFAVCPDGRIILMNGHHRLTQLSKQSGKTLNTTVKVHQCIDNDTSVASLWATFDSGSNRSFAQALSNSRKVAGNDDGLPGPAAMKTIVSGVLWARNRFSNPQGKRINSEQLAISNEDEVRQFSRELHDCIDSYHGKKRLLTVAAYCSFFAMWKSQPELSIIFIEQYVSGENLKENNPILRLRNYMFSRPSGAGGAGVIKHQITLFYSAWSSFINDKDMKLLKPKKDLPLIGRW